MASLYYVEDPRKYTAGGYHPIDIGDQLHHGRYRIIHRLGHGGYATVWLALNQHYDNAAHPDAPRWRYVAVKIATASSNNCEAAILRRLQAGHRFHDDADRKHPGSQFIIALLDEFQITGPNGSHCCIVTELLGPTVRDVKNCVDLPGWAALPVLVGRRFAVQAANAVAFLHSQGIVHADLHLANVAFSLSVDVNSWTVEEVYAALGNEPYTIPFSDALGDASAHPGGSSHHPKHLVNPPAVARLFALCNTSTPSIRIIDFSESFELPSSGQVLPGTPMPFAAPELLLKLPGEVSQSIDLWALGCCIFQFLGYSDLFVGDLFGSLPFFLADIVAVLGGEKAIPERFRDAVRNSGALEYLGKATLRSDLDRRIKSMRGEPDDGEEDEEEDDEDDQDTEDEEDEEYDEICPLDAVDGEVMLTTLRKMLVFDPRNRAAASTAVAIMSAAWNIHQCGCADDHYETSNFLTKTLLPEAREQEDTGLNDNAEPEEVHHSAWEGSVSGIIKPEREGRLMSNICTITDLGSSSVI